MRRGFLLSVVAVSVCVSGAWRLRAADQKGTPQGLQGILPSEVPADLSDAIAALPESWKTWGGEVSEDLDQLYGAKQGSASEQRQTLTRLRSRLATLKSTAVDPRYRGARTQLASLHGSLKRRLDVAEAALDTLEVSPGQVNARVEASLQRLGQAAQVVESYLKSVQNGESWRTYLQTPEVVRTASSRVGTTDGDVTPALQATHQKLKRRETADRAVQDFLNKPQFVALEVALDDYVQAVKAQAAEPNQPAVRQSLTDLVAALENFEADPGKANARAVRTAYEKVRGAAPDGGDRITRALRSDYLNYNLRLSLSEGFINKVVSERRQESGPVVDCILGANVYGEQTTVTDVSFNVQPSVGAARFDITLKGTVNSNTQGVTPQATVYTYGTHYFTAEKPVIFDGDRFATLPARIGVSANNHPFGATTGISGFPILGGIAERIAIRRANDLRGESEAIAASRVQEKVLPRFDAEVDKEFGPAGKANQNFQEKVASRLQDHGLYPDAKVWSSSDTYLFLNSRLMASGELGGAEPPPALLSGRGLSVTLHESLLNNSLDRLELAGKTISEDEVRRLIADQLSSLLNREVTLPAPEGKDDEKAPKIFVFDAEDPIRIRARNGVLTIVLRSGFKRDDEEIPAQTITVPLRFEIEGDKLLVSRDDVSVSPVKKPTGGGVAKQLSTAGVLRKKIENAFPPRELDRAFTLDQDGRKVRGTITDVTAVDGWITITAE